MDIGEIYLTKNDCYNEGKYMIPAGIVVHSTGANNPTIRRYVAPDDGVIGENTNHNDWNRPGVAKCVHYFIGYDKDSKVRCYNTLPLDFRPWGCGKGDKGSYNRDHIQFEICEDDLENEEYFNKAFSMAIELCVYLCKELKLSPDSIVSHKEAHIEGYASNHSDPEDWMKNFDKTMDWFRKAVEDALGN